MIIVLNLVFLFSFYSFIILQSVSLGQASMHSSARTIIPPVNKDNKTNNSNNSISHPIHHVRAKMFHSGENVLLPSNVQSKHQNLLQLPSQELSPSQGFKKIL